MHTPRMRKRYGLLATACAVLLAVALALLLTREREPVYEGKDLSYWAARCGANLRDIRDQRAKEAVLTIGTNNLDLLVRRISYDHNQDMLLKTLRHIPVDLGARLNSRLLAPRLIRRTRQATDAQQALLVLGPAAAPAIPQLTKLVDSGTFIPSARAVAVLTHLGDQGLAVVTSRAALTNNPKRLQLIRVLAFHTNYPPAFAVLTNALSDPDLRVRQETTDILNGRVFE